MMAQLQQTSNRSGFSVVEVAIVIAVIGILAGIVMSADDGLYVRSRDNDRAGDTQVIATELENYYRVNASIAGPSYPTASQITANADDIFESAADTRQAPRSTGGSSIEAADNNNVPQYPAITDYIYQPFDVNGNLCDTQPCVRFKLYYRNESEPGDVVTLDSRRQQ